MPTVTRTESAASRAIAGRPAVEGKPSAAGPRRGESDHRSGGGKTSKTTLRNAGPGRATGSRRSKASQIFLAVGVSFLVAGVAMLGWVVWEMYGTNIGVRDDYDRQVTELQDMWAQGPVAAPAPADDPAEPNPDVSDDTPLTLADSNAFALLRIPALGLVVPIQQGTDPYSLSRGVGWETYTAKPGELGNFVIAGHHSSHGQPFDHLQDLNAGDEYTVETKDAIYTYRLLNSPRDLTVDYRETWVTLPDPYGKTMTATRHLGTLLTCKEVFSTPLRSIGFAELVNTQLK